MRQTIERALLILLGSFISAAAVNAYLVPHHLLSGGVSGVSLIIQYLSAFPAGVTFFLFNVPLFILAYRHVDLDFAISSFVGMAGFSVFMVVTQNMLGGLRVDDVILASVFGGVINGFGAGLSFRARGSQGGTDIIAVVLKRKYSINIGSVTFLINLAIVIVESFFFGMQPAMLSLLSMYASSHLVDKVQEGFDRKKTLMIVTEKAKEVADGIMHEIHRGATLLMGEGAYTGEAKKVIYCVITLTQLSKIKHLVETIDPDAFMTVNDAAEVLGKGFRRASL